MTLRISTVVREKRKAKGLTQEQLAELISVSSGYIGQVERGELTPSISILAMLIDILGIDANTFFLTRWETSLFLTRFLCVCPECLQTTKSLYWESLK